MQDFWVDPAGKRHRGKNPFQEATFTPEQAEAIREGWTANLAEEHSKGLHAAGGWRELGCAACLVLNPICKSCGPPTHHVNYHLDESVHDGRMPRLNPDGTMQDNRKES